MSKFIIEFDEEKQECPFHIVYPFDDELDRQFTTRYCNWLMKKCTGWYKQDGWNDGCPLMKVKDVTPIYIPYAGRQSPKVYEEVDYA